MEYRQYEEILARCHEIDFDDISAFHARMKQLRIAGVPKVMNPGKGQRLRYNEIDLWETRLALSMLEAGLPPHRVTLLFERTIRKMNLMGTVKERDDDQFLVVETHLNAGKGADIDDVQHNVILVDIYGLMKHFQRPVKPRFQFVINLTKITTCIR